MLLGQFRDNRKEHGSYYVGLRHTAINNGEFNETDMENEMESGTCQISIALRVQCFWNIHAWFYILYSRSLVLKC